MLSVETIDLHYGAAQALRGVSLQAEAGKVTAVLGRNGVGKTSLMRAIVGQQPVSKGAVKLDGRDISRLAPYDRARQGIAFVPQGREIFPLLTVKENLETGFAPASAPTATCRPRSTTSSRFSRTCWAGAAATSRAASSSSSPSAAPW